MAISRVTQGGADTSVAVLSGLSPGDFVIAVGHNNATAAIPPLPSGWSTPTNGTVQAVGAGTDCASRVVARTVPAAGLTSLDFISTCDRITWVALRGSVGSLAIGNVTPTAANGGVNNIKYGALALTPGPIDQWLLAFGGRVGGGLNLTTDDPPTDLFLLVARPAGSGDDCALFSSEGTRATDWPETDVPQGGISCQFTSFVIEVIESTDTPPLAPEVTIEGGPGFAHFHTSEFQPHPDDPTDTHQSTKYQLATDSGFTSLVVDEDLPDPNLTDYRREGLSAGTYYGRAAHVGENFDGDWSETIEVVVTAGVTVGNTPTLSPVDETQDAIRVSISPYTNADGAVEPEDFDAEDPHPYLVYSEFQIRLTSSPNWDAENILETIIVQYIDGDLEATFEGRTAGASHELRGRQFDSRGLFTAYSADLTRSTDATPADAPLQPTIDDISCGRDIVITGSAFAHSAAGTHAQTRVRICYGSSCQVITFASAVTTVTLDDVPPGSLTVAIAYGDNAGAWGPYSATEACVSPDYPPTVVFTAPANGQVISATTAVTWEAPDPNEVGWRWDGQRSLDGGASYVSLFTDQASASHNFTVTGLANGLHLMRVCARNPDTDETGEWSYIALNLDRTGSRAIHRHFADYDSDDELFEEWTQIWDDASHITWGLRDTTDPETGTYRVGLEARNVHSGTTIRRSALAFLGAGQPDEFDLTVAFEQIAERCQWYPYQFATPFVTRAGSLIFGTDEGGARTGRLSLMAWQNGWYLGQGMICVSDAFRDYASAYSAAYAMRSANQSRSFQYGRALSPGTFFTVTDRTHTASPTHTSTGMSSTTSPRVGGAYFYTDEDGVLGRGRQIFVMKQSVRRAVSGGQTGWNITTRILGPGTSLETTQFLAETNASGQQIICGACGIAFEDMDRAGVGRSEGVVFTDFSLDVLSYGSCEPPDDVELGCEADWRFTTFRPDDITPQYGTADEEGNVIEADYYDNRTCPRPFLMPPKDFSETEIDYPAGASTIGSIRVGVLDKRLERFDQDTGIVTAILDDCIGRRAVLERWREDLGYVTVFDGVIESVQMDQELVVYWFNLRDPREREREVELFSRNETFSVYPQDGPVEPYGELGSGEFLIPAAEIHEDAEFIALGVPGPGDIYSGYVRLTEATAAYIESFVFPLGGAVFDATTGVYRFPEITVRWRPAAGGAWTYLRDMPAAGLSGVLSEGSAIIPPGPLQADWRVYMASFDADDLPDHEDLIDVQILAAKTTQETPFFWDEGTFGDLLLAAYAGDFTDAPPRIRYSQEALEEFAANTPRARFIAYEPAKNLREWVQENIFAPLGYAPSFDEDMRIIASQWEMPSSDEELVEIDPDWIIPVGDFEVSTDSIVNKVSYTYIRETLQPEDTEVQVPVVGFKGRNVRYTNYWRRNVPSPWARLLEEEVTREYVFEPSTELVGTKDIEYKPTTVRSTGATGVEGLFAALLNPEFAAQLADKIANNVLSRFGWGAHEFYVGVRSGMSHGPGFDPYTLDLTVGQWLIVDVSYLPEFSTGERGHRRYMQIKSITDPEIHYRRLRLIDGGPVLVGEDGESDEGEEDVLPSPTLGALSETSDMTVEVPVFLPTSAPDGYQARVDYAISDSQPSPSSPLWQPLGYVTADTTLTTPIIPAGETVWARARGELMGRRPTPWVISAQFDVSDTPGLLTYRLSFASDGLVQAAWTPNDFAEGLRFEISTGEIGHTASFGTYDDVDSDSPLVLNFTGEELDYGEEAYVRVTAYPGFAAGSVTGSPGSVYTLLIQRPVPADSADHGLGDHTDTFFVAPENRVLGMVPTFWPESESDSAEGFYLTHGGIPPGGTTGQVPKKQSNADFDVAWEDDSGAGGGGYDEGTSFPGSPSTNDKYYRTDRNILYFYDGTRWLSVHEYQMPIGDGSSPNETTTAGTIGRGATPQLYQLWIIRVEFAFFVATTNNGTNFWTFTVTSFETGGGSANPATTNSSALSANTRYRVSVSVGSALATTSYQLHLITSKTGSPGNASCYINLVYRLIG